jgi:hypothetical protein
MQQRLIDATDGVLLQNAPFYKNARSIAEYLQDLLHGRHNIHILSATASTDMSAITEILLEILLSQWANGCPWMSARVRRSTVAAVLQGVIEVCVLVQNKSQLVFALPIVAQGIMGGLTELHFQGVSNRNFKRQTQLFENVLRMVTHATLIFIFEQDDPLLPCMRSMEECISNTTSVAILEICQNFKLFACWHDVLSAIRLSTHRSLRVFSKMKDGEETTKIIQTQTKLLLHQHLTNLMHRPHTCCHTRVGARKRGVVDDVEKDQKQLPTRMEEILGRFVASCSLFSDVLK